MQADLAVQPPSSCRGPRFDRFLDKAALTEATPSDPVGQGMCGEHSLDNFPEAVNRVVVDTKRVGRNNATMNTQRLRRWQTLLLFAIVGPPVGAIPFVILFLPSDPRAALLSIVLAFPIGFIPAVLAGAFFIVVFRVKPDSTMRGLKVRALTLGIVSGIVGGLPFWLLLFVSNGSFLRGLTAFRPFFVVAALAGGCCALLVVRLRLWTPDQKTLGSAAAG